MSHPFDDEAIEAAARAVWYAEMHGTDKEWAAYPEELKMSRFVKAKAALAAAWESQRRNNEWYWCGYEPTNSRHTAGMGEG